MLLFLYAWIQIVIASAPDPRVTVQGARIEAEAPVGHHFNLKAPNRAEPADGKPVPPSGETAARIEFTLPREVPSLVLTLHVCDDQETFCERIRLQGSSSGDAWSWVRAKPGGSAPAAGASPPAEHLGFLLNRPDEALERARRERKPLLIDFFGIWCPPCNELDEQVFSEKRFTSATQGWVKLKLDSDSEISWPLKARYRVGGYPTLILANPEGEEISRIVGYRPLDRILGELDQTHSMLATGVEGLRKKAKAGDREARDRLGLIHLERKEYEKAREWFQGTKAHPVELWDAEIELASAAGAQQEAAALEKAVANLPGAPRSVSWRERWAGLVEKADPARARNLREEAVALARKLVANPKPLEGLDETPADLQSTVASLLEDLGRADEARKAWSDAAKLYGARVRGEKDRGDSLEQAYCLWKSGDFEGADRIYLRLIRQYPDEFTFYFARARMLVEKPDPKGALETARQAFDRSYGDNRLRSAHLLAKSLAASDQAAEARTLLAQVLAGAKLPEDPGIRTHRYAKQLRELAKELESKN